MTEMSGNVILLKDLSNICAAASESRSRNDLDKTVKLLIEIYSKLV